MRAVHRSITFAAVVVLAGLTILSCGGTTDPGGGGGGGGAKVIVTPATDSIVIGSSVTLSARVVNAQGQTVNGAKVFWNTSNANIATVSSNGAVTSVDTGTVQIAASSNGVSGLSNITVLPKPVASVHVTPQAQSIKVGQKFEFQAQPLDAGGNALTGRVVTWASSDPTIATVDDTGLVTGVAVGPTTITATSEGVSGSAALSVGAQTAASITVAPPSVGITVGQTSQLTPTVKDATGAVIAGAPVTWSVDNPGTATVSSTGLVTGIAAGSATVTATSGAAHIGVAVTVSPVPANAVVVSPGSATLVVAQQLQLSAIVTDADGNPLGGRTVTWTSSNPAAATVSGTGNVTAVAPGTTTITGTSGTAHGTATITVKLVPVATVDVDPAAAALFTGETQQLTAIPHDADGNTLSLTGRTVTWKSSKPSVASVSGTGLVTATGVGSAVITATVDGQPGLASVTVSLVPVASVNVTPTPDTLVTGKAIQLVAQTLDSVGHVLTGRAVSWDGSNDNVAIVSSTGRVVAQGVGTATITATSEGQVGTATIVVIPVPVASVTVAPPTKGLTVGETFTFTATTKDASGNVLTGRTVTWSSDNTAAATVDANGLATAVAAGTAHIIATSEGQTGSATLTVAPVPVATVSVTPQDTTMTAGDAAQFTAQVKDSDGNLLSGRVVTWTSSNEAVATVSSTGMVTAVAGGPPVTITATSETVPGSTTVTVKPAPPPPPPPGP
jgi:uncharacterized protein YjdB